MVEIYSVCFAVRITDTVPEGVWKKKEQPEELKKLQDEVNAALSQHAGASVQWLQNGSAGYNQSFVQLTAIVTY